MKKASSERSSRASDKKLAATESTVIPKKSNTAEEVQSYQQNDGDDIDNEEEDSQPLPALTTSSADNIAVHAAVSAPGEEDATDIPVENTADAAMTKIHGCAHEGTGTSISSQIQKIIARELTTPGKKGKVDLQSVPMKEYLEQTVIPIVHQGLLAVARERPAAPIEYLAAYFLKHKHKYMTDYDLEQQQMYNIDQDKLDKTSDNNVSLGNPPLQSENLPQQQGPSEASGIQT